MDHPELFVEIDAPTGTDGLPLLVPGSRARVDVRLSGATAPGGLRWRLFWETEGKGDTDAEVAAQGELQGSASSWRVDVALPQGPWSYAGTLLKLHWFFEASVVAGATTLDAERRVLLLPASRLPAPAET